MLLTPIIIPLGPPVLDAVVPNQSFPSTTSNKSLEEFKKNVNEMIIETRKNFLNINNILEKYINYDYRDSLEFNTISSKGEFQHLIQAVNKLREAITQMLLENQTNGIDLQNSSKILLHSVDKLNSSSNEATKSLQNTATVLGNITEIIQINSAIDILEQQVKSNAEVSSQTNNIAIKTSNIANTIVNNTNQKKFI